MRKIFLALFLVLLFSFPIFNLVQAEDAEWCDELTPEERRGGLVPCGRSCDDPFTPEDETIPCQLCHFFAMIDRWIDGFLVFFIPILAALMIAIGGFMYIFAYVSSKEGGPEMISRAKRLLTAVFLGILIIYGAFLFIGVFLNFIGLAQWTEDIYQSWWRDGLFEIPCP